MIFGKKERALFERASSDFSDYINTCYNNTKTFHDGKWMMIDIHDDTHVSDIINLIKIKKKPNPKSVAMCGYKCDLCKAYAKNIEKNDERIKLSAVWAKYNNLDISPEDIYCDGCRSKKKNAKLIDDHCPLRKCVALKNLNSCIDCLEYPCENFNRRRGLCEAEAKEKLKTSFCKDEFNDFLLAYDNKTRIDKYKKYVGSKFSDNK